MFNKMLNKMKIMVKYKQVNQPVKLFNKILPINNKIYINQILLNLIDG